MPELPEVEILARHLRPLVVGKTIHGARVFRPKVLLPTEVEEFCNSVSGAVFKALTRRGKYLVFDCVRPDRGGLRAFQLLGHLGMTGRIYLAGKAKPLPKHTAAVLDLGEQNFVFEDTRYFGRLTLDTRGLSKLGPEPLDGEFTVEAFARGLRRSGQAIKIKLLDQRLVAGVGNIYASEALFGAGISPGLAARRLSLKQVQALRLAVRRILAHAIRCGSTVALNYGGADQRDGLFYFGRAPVTPDFYEERLRVYDREGQPCPKCGAAIRRIVQGARSTFYCPKCQRSGK